MRFFAIILLLLFFIACNQHSGDVQKLQSKIDSLEKRLAETYKPGLGEFMSGIQIHHAKLWFAGQNQNWPLANFEIHEIQEALDDVQKFCSDREETRSIGMINGPVDSLTGAIQQKDLRLFSSRYALLTQACNNCHLETKHKFNIVTIPSSTPVVNQDFRPLK
ncbi:MAG: hypothetical protein E6H07_17230 [Bacteroidetes bacterium]|nr:MAG: hypothetical protein E6H07_17230 [Bacteroidota bacterium]